MEEVSAINELTKPEVVKAKRSCRRGRITRLKAKLDEFKATRLSSLNSKCLNDFKDDLVREIKIHQALQLRYEQLLQDKDITEDQMTEELTSAAETHDIHRDLLRQTEEVRSKQAHYTEALLIQAEYDNLVELGNPKVPEYEKDCSRLQKRLNTFLQQTLPLAEDEELKSLRETCKGYLEKNYRTLNHSREQRAEDRKKKPAESDRTEPTKTVYHERTRLDIDMPTFSGKPLDWRPFYKLFSSTLETRGSKFSNHEKVCLLLKAMTDEKAKRVVMLHSQGDNGYEKAVEALINHFGSPAIVFPHHVKRTTVRETIDFNKKGFSKLRERFLLPYQAMQDMKVATLSQYLAALACEDFSPRMKEEWTKHIASKSELPTLEDLFAYTEPLEYKMASLNLSPSPSPSPSHSVEKSSTSRRPHNNSASSSTRTSRPTCGLCHESHGLHRCPVFLGYDIPRRIKYVKDQRGCTNCLNLSHSCSNCPSSYTCKKCNQKHNTLLHREDTSTTQPAAATLISVTQPISSSNSNPETPPPIGFLHTALVTAKGGERECLARVAMDTGSSSSLITEALASQLKLKRYPQELNVTGVYTGGVSKHYVKVALHSRHDDTQHVIIKMYVISKLPSVFPPNRKDKIAEDKIAAIPYLKDLALADPDFGGPLDALIGSLDYGKCVLGAMKYHVATDVSVQPTVFGWTATGPMDYEPPSSFALKIQTTEDPLSHDLAALWTLDKTPDTPLLSSTDESIIYHFNDTHSINEDGRYKVQLPRIDTPMELGMSRYIALQRFHHNEKSLLRRGKLEEFTAALQEYLHLGHAEIVPPDELSRPHYYLPVHGIFKNSSTTTKIRPVFDASAKTSTGVSLNDILHTGPNMYPLLSDILIRFRQHRIGFSSDISKMFREVCLHESEKDLHRFLLRNDQGIITDCRMRRLTFGVRPSPFLATQVIRHLAEKHRETHPIASVAILRDFYVDDYVSGADSVEEAKEIRSQLCDLLKLAGMNLRKWRSSDQTFRNSIPADLVETEDLRLTSSDRSLKALGIHWDVVKDELHVPSPEMDLSSTPTKRIIASAAARVFDVLGLFAPATILAKILLQKLWIRQITWDQPLPEDLHPQWEAWLKDLPYITSHAISRRYSVHLSPVVSQSLHGFSDASKDAYGAVVYLRQIHEDSTISTTIVITKARVSPVKPLTIPRAELVAAYLLSKLLTYVSQLLHITDLFAWTDSSIVLCWLRKLPSTLNTFVAHRVAAIQELLTTSKWHHVSTHHNPADLLSRGMSASQLQSNTLWWDGPPWLKSSPEYWPSPQFDPPRNLPEAKAVTLLACPTPQPSHFWEAYSSFPHLVRVYSRIRRFWNNCRKPKEQRIRQPHLTTLEYQQTKKFLFRESQKHSYPEVFRSLQRQTQLPRAHVLSKFKMDIDENGLLTITSRIRDHRFSRQPRKLIPLSIKSSLTRLYIASLHKKYLHAGVSTLMSVIGDSHFIPALRNYLKKVSRACPVCQRAYNSTVQQQMGLLPAVRTTPAPPFQHTGLDFAGPFHVKRGHTRRPVLVKTYACLFVCLTTKAIHLELCADLTTEEFLATLRRFCARRGTPAIIHSDNGSNFVGAFNEIKEIRQLVSRSAQPLSHFCSEAEITWNFIPPRTPHFGGIWEAGVKSMKTLLRKLITPHSLQFHELYSVLVEVEAVLNSRPLTPLHSTDADEQLVLTPGHFLIGRPLVAPPSKPASQAKITSLRRWQLVQRLTQDLWTTWKASYLQSIQRRHKWTSGNHQFSVGDVVFLKDDAFSYRRWPLARITRIMPGDDNITRTMDVECKGKIFRRSSSQLIPLYIEDQLLPPPVCSGPAAPAAD